MPPTTPLDVITLRRQFAHYEYETMAGWRPMADFDPYGMAPADGDKPAGVNWWAKGTPYVGQVVTVADGTMAIQDVPRLPQSSVFVLGHFPIRECAK